MQLNKFTDYALRILMYISRPRESAYTIAEIAADLQVSQNHLVKVVHFMGKQNWLITTRGKGGGLRGTAADSARSHQGWQRQRRDDDVYLRTSGLRSWSQGS